MKERHSVRAYIDRPIEADIVRQLRQLVERCNSEGDLNIRLVTDEPTAFGASRLARYGKFSGVSNYFVLAGKKSDTLDERVGYYGERLVLEAQRLGLNTCWVGLTYKKNSDTMATAEGEKLVCVIALGYGENQGADHKLKSPDKVSKTPMMEAPNWYQRGVAAALLAPTAMNQQKFVFEFVPQNSVTARAKLGFYSKVDLGIVKYHFEIGAGKENFKWNN